MSVMLWCLVVAAFLPFVLAMIGGYLRQKQCGQLDNHYPRVQQQQVRGAAARALGAQQNAWEALMMFTAVVVVVRAAGADTHSAGITAVVFVALRLLHAVFYLADQDKLRSLAFALGVACLVRLIVLAV